MGAVKRQESAEDYLEAILMLKNAKGYVRSIDVANHLGFTKPSISIAMKKFREEGLIVMAHDGEITLTDEGLRIAESVYDRHQTIAKALMMLGVDEKTAYEDSCRIEHDISEAAFAKVKECVMKHESAR